MMLVPCSVRPSRIDGLGLFADEFIPKGALVWKFDPEFEVVVSLEQIENASEHVKAYFDRFGYGRADMPGKLVMDIDDGRYINHDNNPNLDSSVPGQGTARRDIHPGEEITCDYDELEVYDYEMQAPRQHFDAMDPGFEVARKAAE